MDMDTTLPPQSGTKSFPASLHHIISELKKHRSLKPSEIRRIIIEANVKEEDLKPWSDFDHPAADSYGRKLVYDGGNFEVMVMSWTPGDFSTIHDHGSTQWGAVQIFGPAEHATFRMEEDSLCTLARWDVEPGDVVGVSNCLIHQMGNPTDNVQFLSLHVYGLAENIESVTGDARVFDLEKNTIQRVDGGVFFTLPPAEIKRVEKAPIADWPTYHRHMVELTCRLRQMKNSGQPCIHKNFGDTVEETFSILHFGKLKKYLQANFTEGKIDFECKKWCNLMYEIKAAAKLQRKLQAERSLPEPFFDFVEMEALFLSENEDAIFDHFNFSEGKIHA